MLFTSSMIILRQYFGSEAKLPISIASFGSELGVILIVQIMSGFVQAVGWRGSFLLIACMLLQICIMAMSMPNPRSNAASPASVKSPSIQWSILKNHRFVLILIVTNLYVIVMQMLLIVLLDYGKQMNFTDAESTFLLTFIGLMGIPGRVLVAMLCHFNKVSSVILVYVAAICLGCGVLCLKYSNSYELSFVFAFLIGIANGMIIILIWIVPIDMFPQEKYASASGITMIVFGLGCLVSGPFAGKLLLIMVILYSREQRFQNLKL